jgi:hypothetical protein
MTGIPMTALDLTDYLPELDEPRPVYPQSGTARRMSGLLRERPEPMTKMISAGEIGTGVTMLISDAGTIVLRGPAGEVEVTHGAVTDALARIRPVADLVARSETPISGMSAPIARSLEHFGCTVEEG